MRPHPEEFFSGASIQGTIGNLCLLGQVLCTLYGGHHPLYGEEGCQVGCVGRDDDEGEKPPNSSDNSTRERPGEDKKGKKSKEDKFSISGTAGRVKGVYWGYFSILPIFFNYIYCD